MLKKFDSFMNWLASASSYAGIIGILIIMLVICWDIANRLFFDNPIIGIPEIAQNSLAAIAFLMLPSATHLSKHVRSTMITNRLPKKGAYTLQLVTYVIGMLLFMGIVFASWEPMLHATKIKDFQGEGFRVPLYPVWWAIIFGAALSSYQCLSKVVLIVKAIMGREAGNVLDGGIQL